jgi:hypothetical protein
LRISSLITFGKLYDLVLGAQGTPAHHPSSNAHSNQHEIPFLYNPADHFGVVWLCRPGPSFERVEENTGEDEWPRNGGRVVARFKNSTKSLFESLFLSFKRVPKPHSKKQKWPWGAVLQIIIARFPVNLYPIRTVQRTLDHPRFHRATFDCVMTCARISRKSQQTHWPGSFFESKLEPDLRSATCSNA